MSAKITRTRLAAAIIVGLGVLLILAVVFLTTPTTSILVRNDTSGQVTITECGSDPATVNPGQSINLYAPANPSSTLCTVYRGETREYLGCLGIPKSEFLDGSVIRLSKMDPTIPISKCGG